VNAEPESIACNVKRIVIEVTLVARGYEMRSFECPRGTDARTPVSSIDPDAKSAFMDSLGTWSILIGWSKLESNFAIASSRPER